VSGFSVKRWAGGNASDLSSCTHADMQIHFYHAASPIPQKENMQPITVVHQKEHMQPITSLHCLVSYRIMMYVSSGFSLGTGF
jgi:hypothetical protein